MKKTVCVTALALVLVMGLWGCAGKQASRPATQPQAGQTACQLSWKGPSHLNMDRFLLVEDGVSIKAESFCYDAGGDGYVRLYIQNNTNEAAFVTAQVSVNGEAVEIPFAHEVDALGELACDLFLTADALAGQGLEQIYEISAIFRVESAGEALVSEEMLIDLAAA